MYMTTEKWLSWFNVILNLLSEASLYLVVVNNGQGDPYTIRLCQNSYLGYMYMCIHVHVYTCTCVYMYMYMYIFLSHCRV